MLRFLSVQYNVDYVVQPIPVTHLAATLNGATVNGASADLSWHSQPDSLEPTAAPDRYVVQRRIDDGGWDSGFLVTDTRATVPIDSVGVIYSYRVLAVNDGGRSMPSEVIAVGRAEQAAGAARDPDKMVRVVSAFDRVSPPAWFDSSDLAGFAPWLDQGVPEGYDISYTGAQYDYDLTSPWRDDDEPGFGASHASLESSVVAGNTHDFVAVHGRAILNAGYSFDSASDEAVADGRVSLAGYAAIDVLLGEERATPRPKRSGFDFAAFPKALQNRLRDYHEQGGAMLVSGAYVGSDLRGATADSMFAADVLHIVYRTNHASTTGSVYSIRNAADLRLPDFTFETELNELQYAVEAPDAIEPANGAFRFLRYDDSNMNAGVGFDGSARVAVLGFPLEAIRGDVARNAVFEGLLDFLIPQVSR